MIYCAIVLFKRRYTNVPEVLNVHVNENNLKIYFFRRTFFQAVKN